IFAVQRIVGETLPQRDNRQQFVERNRQLLHQSSLCRNIRTLTTGKCHVTNVDSATAVGDIIIKAHAAAGLSGQLALTIEAFVGLQVAQARNRFPDTPVADGEFEVRLKYVSLLLLELNA